jgi:hypothetical protein
LEVAVDTDVLAVATVVVTDFDGALLVTGVERLHVERRAGAAGCNERARKYGSDTDSPYFIEPHADEL